VTTMNDETAVIRTVPEDDHGDLSAALAAAAPRRWWNRGTVGLGVAALLMGGFLGGVQAQKQWGVTEAAATSGFPSGGARGGGFPAGTGASGAPGGAGARGSGAATGAAPASSGATGKVKLVDGRTIYVEKADGTVVTVRTDGATTVSTAAEGKLSDVRAGQAVTVEGATAEDGSVTATKVTATR
jgi:hypothetical protein